MTLILNMVFQGWAMLRLPWILLIISYVTGAEISNVTNSNTTVVCDRYYEYDNFDIRTITGKWGAVELYMHLSNEGVKVYNSCPRITIWESDEVPRSTFGPSTENQVIHVQHIYSKFRRDYRYLRLLWDEAGQTIEYGLYFRNDSAGYWQSFDGQNGTLTTRQQYQQFTGTVQVLKAVNDHLVLNFCQEASNGVPAQLYSVLFSREPGSILRWEMDAVHALLQNKKLSIASRRMVCGNDAGKPIYSVVFSLLSCILAYAISAS